ncbi:hypothetical protein TWF730_007046 [Orbilia blumenaviensis]|uniref:F-box domain-containing protein n=1 Tax=Orbilia blumenaviensis TaxID=1796055 RepID=A0AAV9VG32_9PEZI
MNILRNRAYYPDKSGSRYSVLDVEEPILPEQENRLQGPRVFTATYKALGINEVLEHILSFVNPVCFKGVGVSVMCCEDSDGFWDLYKSCRLVDRRWRELIDNSYILQKQMWRGKYFKEGKERAYPDGMVSKSGDYVIHLKAWRSQSNVVLCYPFLSWIVRTIRALKELAETTEVQSVSQNTASPDPKDPQINFRELRKRFIDEKWPNVFFTEPPVSEVRILFTANNPVDWGRTTPKQGLFSDTFTVADQLFTVTPVRCPDRDSYHYDTITNGVLISNPEGVTVSDVMYTFDEYVKIAADPQNPWNKGGPKPWRLEGFSIGAVSMVPEHLQYRHIGFCRHSGLIFVEEESIACEDDFQVTFSTEPEQPEGVIERQ